MMNPIGIRNEDRIGSRDPWFDVRLAVIPVPEHGGVGPCGTRVRRSAWPRWRSATGGSCGRRAPAGSVWMWPFGTTGSRSDATHAAPASTPAPSSAPHPGRAPLHRVPRERRPPGSARASPTGYPVRQPAQLRVSQPRPVPRDLPQWPPGSSAAGFRGDPAGLLGTSLGRFRRNRLGRVPPERPSRIPG
jgi:hypothetical protein